MSELMKDLSELTLVDWMGLISMLLIGLQFLTYHITGRMP